MKTKSPKSSPISTRDEALILLFDIQELALDIQWSRTMTDVGIAQLEQEFQNETKEHSELIKKHIKALKKWAEKHPEEFADKRSIESPAGVMGFRTNPPSLGLIDGETWEAVLVRFENSRYMKKYIRTKSEIDKQSLLQDREELGSVTLKAAGLEVLQKDVFFVEPNMAEATETRLKEGQ